MAGRDMSTCASCGKECNSKDMNTCNKCKMVKYCNAACKKKHRTKHKKKCDRRVAELHEEALFKDPPPREECPICLIPTLTAEQSIFMPCCGKMVCCGCIYAMEMSEGKDLCAFCRMPPPSSDEVSIQGVKKLMNKDNAEAFNQLARAYSDGVLGMPQNHEKANELYLKAGELGCVDGYYNLGISYDRGDGVKSDGNKAKHYHELAAMGGCVEARNTLGVVEWNSGNYDRACKHFTIAAKDGYKKSLDNVKIGFMKGVVTKDEYANTLREHHERQKEMKTNAREEAAVKKKR